MSSSSKPSSEWSSCANVRKWLQSTRRWKVTTSQLPSASQFRATPPSGQSLLPSGFRRSVVCIKKLWMLAEHRSRLHAKLISIPPVLTGRNATMGSWLSLLKLTRRSLSEIEPFLEFYNFSQVLNFWKIFITEIHLTELYFDLNPVCLVAFHAIFEFLWFLTCSKSIQSSCHFYLS